MDPHSLAQHAGHVDQPPPTQRTNQVTRLRQSVLAALLALAVARDNAGATWLEEAVAAVAAALGQA